MGINWKLAAGIILPLVILILIMLWQSGGLTEIKDSVFGFVEEYSPDVDVGLEEVSADEVSIPENQQEELDALKDKLTAMLASNRQDCFSTFGGFSDLGEGDRGTSLVMTYNSDTQKTTFNVADRIGRFSQESFELEMRPCVIAGKKDGDVIAENFFKRFLKLGTQNLEPYYLPVNQIVITYGDTYNNLAGNIIRVTEIGENQHPINDEGDNFINKGYLFKGKNNDICFFPTIKGVIGITGDTLCEDENDEDGLDDDCFEVGEVEGVPSNLNQGNIKRCVSSSGEIFFIYDSIEVAAHLGDYLPGIVEDFNVHQVCEGIAGGEGEKDCSSLECKKEDVADIMAPVGCLVIGSELDSDECGYSRAEEGAIININTFSQIRLIDNAAYGEWEAVKMLESGMRWKRDSDNEELICSGNRWYACAEEVVGEKLTIGVGFEYICEQTVDGFEWSWI